MIGEAIALLAMLLVLAMLAALVVLPIVAVVQFFVMKRRLDALEREVRRLAKRERAEPAGETPILLEVVEPEPAPPVETPAEAPRPAKKKRERPRVEGPDWSHVEAWLGVRGLGWAAVVVLIFTAGFFLKVVFERGWIGELGRVSIGLAVGCFLCGAGWSCFRRGQIVFSQMLTSAGIVILYLATWASFGYYRLIPQDHAGPFLVLLVAEAFLLAALYQAPAIAIMAVIGALLTPILLHADVDRYRGLFIYLGVVNLAVVALSTFRRWWVVTTLALVGTHGLFWIWYHEQYHPDKLPACVTFHLVLFAIYVAQMLIVHVGQRRLANIEELLRLFALALLVGTAGYVLLDPDYHRWMGTFAVGMAIVFALLAGVVDRWRGEDELLLLILIALSMGYVAMVFPLQMQAAWIAVGWAAQGLALWWFGLRIRRDLLHGLGAAFLVLAVGRLVLVDTLGTRPHQDPFVPIFNRYGLPAILVAVSVIVAALLQRRTRPAEGSLAFFAMRGLGLIGVVLLWMVLSIETYDYFIVRANLDSPGVQALLTEEERELPRDVLAQRFAERAMDLRLTAQMSLSVLWGVFALVQLAVGLRLQHRPLRWLALGLFALTLGKVMLIDTERLQGLYRVAAFFALSLMLAAGAWAYQKLRHVLVSAEKEETDE